MSAAQSLDWAWNMLHAHTSLMWHLQCSSLLSDRHAVDGRKATKTAEEPGRDVCNSSPSLLF